MANIKNEDVETYVRLLISEELGFARDGGENFECNPQQNKKDRKSRHKQRNLKDQLDRMEDTSDD
ncbi:MAG: hypothetical protein PVI06_09735 [Desulfobacterales bacterium]|jgi:hypothetical protein